jgi:beta-phosphoglucomutase
MSRFKAVIFDLDGVITDTAHYHYLAWKALAESEGVHFDHAFNENLKGVDRMGSLNLILAGSSKTYSLEQKLALAERKNNQYVELIATMSAGRPAAGRDRGAGCGARGRPENRPGLGQQERVHGARSPRHPRPLRLRGRRRSIANSKPHPEIFLNAAAALGVAPGDCLGVEDAVAGVASIKSAGMFALGIGSPEVLTQADRVIPSLSEFRLNDY